MRRTVLYLVGGLLAGVPIGVAGVVLLSHVMPVFAHSMRDGDGITAQGESPPREQRAVNPEERQ